MISCVRLWSWCCFWSTSCGVFCDSLLLSSCVRLWVVGSFSPPVRQVACLRFRLSRFRTSDSAVPPGVGYVHSPSSCFRLFVFRLSALFVSCRAAVPAGSLCRFGRTVAGSLLRPTGSAPSERRLCLLDWSDRLSGRGVQGRLSMEPSRVRSRLSKRERGGGLSRSFPLAVESPSRESGGPLRRTHLGAGRSPADRHGVE